jgi:hypothetical protein
MKASARFDNDVDGDASLVDVLAFSFRVSRSDVPVCNDLPNLRVMSDSESTLETLIDVDSVVFDVDA